VPAFADRGEFGGAPSVTRPAQALREQGWK